MTWEKEMAERMGVLLMERIATGKPSSYERQQKEK